jgi:hypothetical protein
MQSRPPGSPLRASAPTVVASVTMPSSPTRSTSSPTPAASGARARSAATHARRSGNHFAQAAPTVPARTPTASILPATIPGIAATRPITSRRSTPGSPAFVSAAARHETKSGSASSTTANAPFRTCTCSRLSSTGSGSRHFSAATRAPRTASIDACIAGRSPLIHSMT